MKRRRFIRISLFGSLLTPFFGQAESHPDLETIRGTFRTLTKPGHSDNRATFTPNGGTILFASKRTGKSYYHAVPPGQKPFAPEHDEAQGNWSDTGWKPVTTRARRVGFCTIFAG
jgi:hypothetical protein